MIRPSGVVPLAHFQATQSLVGSAPSVFRSANRVSIEAYEAMPLPITAMSGAPLPVCNATLSLVSRSGTWTSLSWTWGNCCCTPLTAAVGTEPGRYQMVSACADPEPEPPEEQPARPNRVTSAATGA